MPFLLFLKDQRTKLPPAPRQGYEGGTYIITGANTGLGFQAAQHLVQLSAGRVILGVRSPSKGEVAKAQIGAATNKPDVLEVWPLDLSSYDSVRAFAARANTLDRLDAVIENAGIALDKYTISESLETTLTVNVVSTMLLADLLLPTLQRTASTFGVTPHLVIVGSETALDTNGGGLASIQGDVLDGLGPKGMMQRYPISKLLSFYCTREFANLHPVAETGVVVNYVNPGFCTTDLTRHVGLVPRLAISAMRLALARTADEGSRNLLFGAVAGPESHGCYVSACKIADERTPEWMRNKMGVEAQKRVWADVEKRFRS